MDASLILALCLGALACRVLTNAPECKDQFPNSVEVIVPGKSLLPVDDVRRNFRVCLVDRTWSPPKDD